MKKPYLLIAGDNYYPSGGTRDWIARFNTLEEAEQEVHKEEKEFYTTQKKPQQVIIKSYKIFNQSYDWYEIVNLETELIGD